MGDFTRRIRDALVALGRECITREGAAVLLVTLLLVTRHALGTEAGGRWMAGFWGWCVGLSAQFKHRVVQRQVVAIVLQLAVPVVFIWLFHRGRLRDFGLGVGDHRFWLPVTAVIFLIQILVVAFYLSKDPVYIARYPSLRAARDGGTVFWLWESSRVLYMISWEFLFRGYLLFALEKRLGMLACVVQIVPFVIMHMVSGKPVSEVYFTMGSGLVSGLFVLESRSVWPVVFLHAAGAILLDVFIVFG